ncbi:YtxH domain-containing protein [Desertibacillus haloalkaliphilus]|uniref:YtxH domain-containing protein n=1 Tax=Desertibacillus haloalkaliphilus TaxID=1328930 RepID=UPI001C259141|nr:YtxH domain-containing protein [Desertibacillus haloalkaliphilus]MBU8905456.1 YtxH domain-containing protein [Desertibacillus haloalkaliphilus]
MKTKSFIAGIVAGGVIGSVATLLTTPLPGKELRHSVKVNYNTTKDNLLTAKQEGIALKSQFQQTWNEGVNKMKATASEMKDSVDDWKDDIKPHLHQLQKEIDELQKTIDETKRTPKKEHDEKL